MSEEENDPLDRSDLFVVTGFDPACDKCGLIVPAHNDMIRFMVELGANPLLLFVGRPRHLLPVVGDDGEIICVGSPSRAQYLEGQERDDRPEYPYNPEMEEKLREAHRRLLEKFS